MCWANYVRPAICILSSWREGHIKAQWHVKVTTVSYVSYPWRLHPCGTFHCFTEHIQYYFFLVGYLLFIEQCTRLALHTTCVAEYQHEKRSNEIKISKLDRQIKWIGDNSLHRNLQNVLHRIIYKTVHHFEFCIYLLLSLKIYFQEVWVTARGFAYCKSIYYYNKYSSFYNYYYNNIIRSQVMHNASTTTYYYHRYHTTLC